MSSVAETSRTPVPPLWQAIAIVIGIFCLAGLEAGIVMRARAALIDPRTADVARTALVMRMLPARPAFNARPQPWLTPDADVLIDRMLGGPEAHFDHRPGPLFTNLDPDGLIGEAIGLADLTFDWRTAPEVDVPDPRALVVAMVPPPVERFDLRGLPHFAHRTPVALMAALLPNLRETLDIGRLPTLPAPQALEEPHMQVEETWVGRWRKLNPDPFQRVHFAGNVISRCLPRPLMKVLADIAERFGEVKVISGYRSPDHNRRVGGASRSMHMECRAIDFYVHGRNAGLLDYLERRRDVGGYARYPFGSYHIDNGPRRTW